jgi:hypothetical protein
MRQRHPRQPKQPIAFALLFAMVALVAAACIGQLAHRQSQSPITQIAAVQDKTP